jgi:hypothetical protein
MWPHCSVSNFRTSIDRGRFAVHFIRTISLLLGSCPETESIHCFSDNKNWTPLTFYAEMKHVSLRQAAEELAVYGSRVQLLESRLPEPDEQLFTLIGLASIRFRARPVTPARRNLFEPFGRVHALVLTGNGDPISAAWRRPGWRTQST